MELTSTQFRAITKAKNLLAELAPAMGQNQKAIWNEICSDWADLVLYDPSGGNAIENIKGTWRV